MSEHKKKIMKLRRILIIYHLCLGFKVQQQWQTQCSNNKKQKRQWLSVMYKLSKQHGLNKICGWLLFFSSFWTSWNFWIVLTPKEPKFVRIWREPNFEDKKVEILEMRYNAHMESSMVKRDGLGKMRVYIFLETTFETFEYEWS